MPASINGVTGIDKIQDNSVTQSKITDDTEAYLTAKALQAFFPVGAVMTFAKKTAPTGWLACNGEAIGTSGTVQGVSASELTNIRNMLLADGSPFGTSGSDPRLPDLRGYFVRGWGEAGQNGTNGDGTASGSFGSKQAAAMLNHTHTGTTGNQSANHTHSFNVTSGGESAQHGHNTNAIITSGNTGTGAGIVTGGGGYFLGNVTSTLNGSGHTHNVSGSTGNESANHTHTVTTGNPSAGGGTETRPANIAMLYCIKY